MSASRRAYAGDDNILARLERDAKRGKSGGPWKHARLAWCMLASVLVVGLIGTLATLARGNMTVTRHGAAPAAAAPADTYGMANSVRGGFAPLPVPVPSRTLGANVYDAAPEPSLMPPLVMLKPAAPAVPKNAAAAPKPARNVPERVAATKPAPARPAAAVSRPAVPTRSMAAAPPRTVVAAAPARSRKLASGAAAAAAAEPSAVDSDVALLSAIIMHASRHSAERAQMEAARCGAGKKCVQNDPMPSLKITD